MVVGRRYEDLTVAVSVDAFDCIDLTGGVFACGGVLGLWKRDDWPPCPLILVFPGSVANFS